jgi:hypothetical protein
MSSSVFKGFGDSKASLISLCLIFLPSAIRIKIMHQNEDEFIIKVKKFGRFFLEARVI